RLRTAGAYAAQSELLHARADRLAFRARDDATAGIVRVGCGQAGAAHAGRRVHVANVLRTRQPGSYQHRRMLRAQVLGLVRPARDESAQVEARGHAILVQVQRREAVGRVPAAPALRGEGGIERVLPRGVGDAPPRPAVGQPLAPERHLSTPRAALAVRLLEAEHVAAGAE